MRVAANRRRHEMEAAQMPRNRRDAAASNDVAQDVVDRALNRLEAQERDAILLRFFEGRTFREVGAALSISEEAAKKRVWRGIEKLRQMLTPAGSAAPAAATIAGILTVAHQAPATLASTAAATALTGTGAAISLAKGALIAMAISKTKAMAAGVALMILLLSGAAVVMKDMTARPHSVSYVVPTTKPATRPLVMGDFTLTGQPKATFTVGQALLGDAKTIAEPMLVVAPACTHLQKNQNLANQACTSCHIAANALNKVKLDGVATVNLMPRGKLVLGQNLQDHLVFANVNFVAGAVLNLVDTNGLAAGTDAPAVDVKQPDGTKLSLADFKGKYVLLNFWDSTSKESADQMPHLRAAARDWANEPKLAIVGINVDEKPEVALAFAKAQKMQWMQAL